MWKRLTAVKDSVGKCPYLVKLAKFCITLAIRVKALDVFSSGYSKNKER